MLAGHPDRVHPDPRPADAAARDRDALVPGAPIVPGPGAIGRLQATAGNRAVSQLLRDPSFQLPTPWLLGGKAPEARPGDDLRLDPERTAQAEAEIATRLAADSLLAQIARVRLGRPPPGVGEPGGPDVISGADPRATSPGPPGAAAPTPTSPSAPAAPVPPFAQAKPGEAGDLMDALTAHPAIAAGIARVKEEGLRAYRTAPAGERGLAIVTLITFSVLAVGGAAATPGGRQLLSQLSGKVLPVPGVDWLGVEFNSQGDNHILGVHVDIGGFLPKSWGFGPAGPGQRPPTMTPPSSPGPF
jgi:hypothetical protein